jgi:hypothetical protein
VIAYVREVAACTEQYWCPITHAQAIRTPHVRYHLFFDYGNAQGYRRELLALRRTLRQETVPAAQRVAGSAGMTTEPTDRDSSHGARWLSWFLGAALLSAVVAAALHFSEERAFLRMAERADPSWLILAVLLQAATYVAQGGIWRRVGGAAGDRLSRNAAFELSLAKLFADQALPSAGLSSSMLIAKALEQRQLSAGAVNASVLINVASYHLAYVVALAGALVIVAWHRQTNALVVTTACFERWESSQVGSGRSRPHRC